MAMIAMMGGTTTIETATAPETVMAMATDAIVTTTVARPPREAPAVTRTGPSHTHIAKHSTTPRVINLLPQTTRSRRRPLEMTIALPRVTSPSGSTSLQVYKSRMTRTGPAANSLDRMGRLNCPPVLLIMALHTDPSQPAIDAAGVGVVAEAAAMSGSRLPRDPC